MKLCAADFETKGIEKRPGYPPVPVGLSLWPDGWRRPRYYAFGHPSNNNSTETEAKRAFTSLRREGYTFIWHNAAFDLDVLETHWQVKWPAEWHDTLLLAFLYDPRFPTFSLKPLAERVLGEPPTERDELKDWIIANVPEAKKRKSEWGKHIWRAPGDLVGKYANGDTSRTKALFKLFWRDVNGDPRLRSAYDRERKLTPTLIKMERRGIPIRTRYLAHAVPETERLLATTEGWLLDRLKVPKRDREEFKFTGDCLADALERTRKVDEWILTKKGHRATNAEDLAEVCKDALLVKELEVRSQVATCLQTFMRPWLEQAHEHDGRFYARFNQTRMDNEKGGQIGAVTGRMSMSPNLQNVIRSDKDVRVPKLRDYIWSGSRDDVLIQRDYSQQELRITANAEGGGFLKMYLAQPDIDAHNAVKELIRSSTGIAVERREVKDLNFGLLYGMGVAKLARKLGIERGEASKLSKAHLKALPGIKDLRDRLSEKAKAKEPLFTWGGRRYFCEEPIIRDDRVWSFEYKQLNVYVQGSAADCTKHAMVNYAEAGYDDRWPLELQVHDELLAIAKAREERRAHAALREAMLDVGDLGDEPFQIPMLSDGKTGSISWHRMQKVEY